MKPDLMNSSPTELGTMILESGLWLALRTDEQGLHLHTNEQAAMLLIGDFFIAYPEYRKIVMNYVRDKTNHK